LLNILYSKSGKQNHRRRTDVSSEATDPLTLKAAADLAVERASEQLRRLLRQAVGRLRPFPPFPGAFFTNAIEVEPLGTADPSRGCIVVCSDGELYELRMGVDFESIALGMDDPVSLRSEELHPLELHPCDYINYAHGALTAVVERLLEQEEGA
jgi:hypothetical protein